MTPDFSWDITEDALSLENVQFALALGAPDGMTVSARTTVLGYRSDVMISRLEGQGGRPGVAVGLRPDEWPIGKALPALSHPAIDQLELKDVALVVTDQNTRVPSSTLSAAAHSFYKAVYQSDEFELVLTPGLNLIAAFPIEGMASDDPLKKLFDRLGFQSGVVLLQGSLGRSLAAVGQGAATLDLIKDVYLRALLPPMRPADAPAWFKSGQLGLEITGQPSIGLIGEITVDIEGDILTFTVAAKIQKEGRGIAVALVGGLKTEEPWVHPFDLEWLVFFQTVLKLSVDVKANIGLGFAAKMVIGEKDIDVAIGLKINASGVITNFLFDGESTAGISLADLVALQSGMGQARGALGGGSRRAVIPLDRLPPMEIRDIHLKFALKEDPDLEVQPGFALKGELWAEMRPGAELTNFAGVDFSVDATGIVGKAHLGAYAIGAVSWDDALLDLELTMARQNLTVSGTVDLGFVTKHLDVSITRKGAFFSTETTLLDRFATRLDAEAPFTVQQPVWSVRGALDNDFNGELTAAALGRLRAWADDHERAMAAARAANLAARERADAAAKHLAELEATINQRQADAKRAMESAARAADAAAKAESRAEAALRSAEAALESSPPGKPKERIQRSAAVVKARADLAARKLAVAAKRADHLAKKAIQDALSSDAVEAAEHAAREATEAARAAEQALERTAAMVDRIRAGDTGVIAVDRASFQGRLDTVRGGTVTLHLEVTWMDGGQAVSLSWEFDRLESGAEQLIQTLLAG
jgi:hypothetical protein